jgi:hypothetical protein
MARRDFLHAMVQSYGDVPDLVYFPGDMASIRSYFDYMQLEGDNPFGGGIAAQHFTPHCHL